ncbi:MAG: hypothetical protein JJT89_12585 [Nitriliruptoraceae bacterium]|nr:hypothetical protein [Nitriliruptoraceae bacterium]
MSSTPRDRFPGLALLVDPAAEPGDGAVADLVARWQQAAATGVPLAPGIRASFEDATALPGPGSATEVQVSSDHANLSIAAGEVLVKFLADPAPGEDHGLTVARHLAAVRSAVVPTLLGALVEDGPRPRVLAIATRLLVGAEEGWGRFRDLARAVLERRAEPGASLAAARAAGDAVARFHLDVATPSAVWPTPVVLADRATPGRWADRAQDTLAAARAAAPDPASRQRSERIAAHLASVLDTVEAGVGTPLLRIHGDLHVGQLLTVGDRIVVSDLDGDPALPSHERDRPASPAKDLAALLRSLDHVGRLAALRSGAVGLDDPAVDRWVAAVRQATVAAYRGRLAEGGRPELLAPALVACFETAQLAHEVHYATTRLPEWLPIADAAADAWLDERITDAT